MNCASCGKEISKNDVFCTGCGERLTPFDETPPKQNRFVAAIKARPIESVLYAICVAVFLLTVNRWITVSPSLLTLTSLNGIMPYFSGITEIPDIIRSNFSIINLVDLFFTMAQSLQGAWILPFFAVVLIVGFFAILVFISVFVVLLYSNSDRRKLFGTIAYFISIVVALIPFFVTFMLNNMVSSALFSLNIPSAFLDVRIFTVSFAPYLIILLSVAGLVFLKRLK